MFARNYFEKSAGFTPRIGEPDNSATSLIVVIPCFREPDILETLESLHRCDAPQGRAEVIILVNEPEDSPAGISDYNRATVDSLHRWIAAHRGGPATFFAVGPVSLPRKWAGVGLARKAGMDEALWRFHHSGTPRGIILSLDADTLVEPNYLTSVESHFRENPTHVGATIRFLHLTEGFPARQGEGIRLYEQYMVYYKNAMAWSGYPHALTTVGSAFAVTAEAYMKRGGMTRRKAGEDFYFLQTLTQVGKVGEIETTTLHPSPRVSLRVPFGTGPAMKKWMDGSDELLYAFNMEAFRDLHSFFSLSHRFYDIGREEAEELVSFLPEPVGAFLRHENLTGEFLRLSDNCSRPEIFQERFFHLFNAFRILRFLNFSHPRYYVKTSLEECCRELEISRQETPVA